MSISSCLEKVKDFRNLRGKRYHITSIVKLIVAGLLSNRNNLKSIARFAQSFTPKELSALGFNRKKAPCYTTLTLVMRKICLNSLKEAILELIQHICHMKGINYKLLHLDGKTLNNSNSYAKNHTQVLTVFSSQLKSVGGFINIENKNEYDSMLKFLLEYEIQGKILTADAAFCHEEICEEVIKQGGDFAFTLKGNEPNLHHYSTQTFDQIALEGQEVRCFEENIDLQHGRIEKRKIEAVNMPLQYQNGFRHIKQICKITRERTNKKTKIYTKESVLMVTSLDNKVTVQQLLEFNRSHWSCENNLNWVKDVIFGEDKSTISTGIAPLVVSLFRAITISIISLFAHKITETREYFNNYRPQLFKVFTT